MKRGLVVLALLLIAVPCVWLFGTPSGRLWRLRRQSIADLTLLTLSQPQDETAYEVLVGKLTAEGRFDEAATVYGAWAAAQPGSALPRRKQGEMLLHANKLTEAVEVLGSAIQKDSASVEALEALAYAHFLLGERAKAEETADRALSLAGGSPDASAVKALLWADRHQFSAANEALQKARVPAQKSSLFAAAQGYVADREGIDLPGAIRAFQEATRIDPYHGQAWVWLAEAHLRNTGAAGSISQAEAALDVADRLLAHAPMIPYDRGLAAFQKEDYSGAIAHFQEALQRNPNSVETLHYLQMAQARAGRTQESEETRKRMVRLSDYQRAVNNLQVQLGRTPDSPALWRKLLLLAQANGDQERVKLARQRLSTLPGSSERPSKER